MYWDDYANKLSFSLAGLAQYINPILSHINQHLTVLLSWFLLFMYYFIIFHNHFIPSSLASIIYRTRSLARILARAVYIHTTLHTCLLRRLRNGYVIHNPRNYFPYHTTTVSILYIYYFYELNIHTTQLLFSIFHSITCTTTIIINIVE